MIKVIIEINTNIRTCHEVRQTLVKGRVLPKAGVKVYATEKWFAERFIVSTGNAYELITKIK